MPRFPHRQQRHARAASLPRRRASPTSRPQCQVADAAAVVAAADAVDIRVHLVNQVKAHRYPRAAVAEDAVARVAEAPARIRRRAAELPQHNHQQDAVPIPLRLEVAALIPADEARILRRMLREGAALIRTPAAVLSPAPAVVALVDRPESAT